MKYLLDTNVVSDIRKVSTGEIKSEYFLTWLASVHAGHIYISSLTVLEIKNGILAKQHKDPGSCAKLETWFEVSVLQEYEGRILPFCERAALICAALDVPDTSLKADAMIAATAAANEMGVVTRNVKHFQSYNVPLVNPYDPPDLATRQSPQSHHP